MKAFRLGAGALFLSLVFLVAAGQAHAQVSSADQICAPAVNPCNVTSSFDIAPDAVLDFGTREVNLVANSGHFKFTGGSATVRCGNFNANRGSLSTTAVLNIQNASFVTVEARRSCSMANRPCVDESDCALGTCDTRRCTLRPSRECTGDANCQLGACLPNRRCSGNSVVRCVTDADCNLGTCPAQLTCSDEAENPVNCGSNADCTFGTCSLGSGSITINGNVQGNSSEPAVLVLRAADNVTIQRSITINSLNTDSDGGEVDIEAVNGDVSISGSLSLSGGFFSTGGTVTARAGRDISLTNSIDVTGGDFDGGVVDFEAERDIAITRGINANSGAGAGFGGEIRMSAGRDMSVSGVGQNNFTVFSTDGNTDATNFAGDGGTQEFVAARNLSLNQFTRYRGNGALPDGFGADLFIEAGGNFTLNGQVQSRSLGGQGAGGFLEVITGGGATIGSSGTIDLTGGASGGGILEFVSAGNVDYAGTADVTAGGGGGGGAVLADADGNFNLTGTLVTGGSSAGRGDGSLDVTACRILLGATANMDNKTVGGDNRLTARESMQLLAGSKMTNPSGINVLTYRDPAKPPVRNGTISPAPQLVVDDSLVGCPICGNGELDQGEGCDDGNLVNGDGCSDDCQNEQCIAQTPGYPGVPLCDDGNGCTVDVCNTALGGGTCEHLFLCDDGVACTNDTCVNDQCVNVPVDSACDDGDPCSINLCSAMSGCVELPNDGAACDDGQFCTVGDSCDAFECEGVARDCGDGIDCTVDACNEAGDTCTNTPSDSACDNGLFCDGAETCSATEGCVAGTPVDCSSLDGVCAAGTCDEATDACIAEPANEGDPCDDGDECTADDSCRSGVCEGDLLDPCGVVCGDGEVGGDEECDDAHETFVNGQWCTHECLVVPCGRPTNSTGSRPNAADSLFTLKAAVGQVTCDRRVCDVDSNGNVQAQDALRILRNAVGQPVALNCPLTL